MRNPFPLGLPGKRRTQDSIASVTREETRCQSFETAAQSGPSKPARRYPLRDVLQFRRQPVQGQIEIIGGRMLPQRRPVLPRHPPALSPLRLWLRPPPDLCPTDSADLRDLGRPIEQRYDQPSRCLGRDRASRHAFSPWLVHSRMLPIRQRYVKDAGANRQTAECGCRVIATGI